MRKLFFLQIILSISFFSYAQLELNNAGDIGIGGTATSAKLTIEDTHNTLLRLKNGNGHNWSIGNYKTSLWGSAPNTLAIFDETSSRYLMEFRQDYTYIHDRLMLGTGYSGNASMFELYDKGWIRLNGKTTDAGILFYETGSATSNSAQYGAKIEYNQGSDYLFIGTYQGSVAQPGIYIRRAWGNVGIGGVNWTSNYKLQVFGAAYTTESVWNTSDERFKDDIKDLTNSTEQLAKLRGVTYKNKNKKDTKQKGGQLSSTETINTDTAVVIDTTIINGPDLPELKYGFIAQEVEKVFPALVNPDNEGYLAINYMGFIPVLVEALKEQQVEINELKKKVAKLEKSSLK